MTENEAIKILDTEKHCLKNSTKGLCKINCGECKENIPIAYQEKSYEVAITALKEIQLYKDGKLCLVPKDVYSKQCCELDAYKEIGTVEECREAVEKQKAKKPIPINYQDYADKIDNAEFFEGSYFCPNCGTVLRSGSYCNRCGQKLGWNENLEGVEYE